MRRLFITIAAVAGGLVVLAAAILLYAAANLNSIIADRREAILAKASAAIGREVKAADIKASLGWGVSADISGVTISDDAASSPNPFVKADNVYARLELMPLLAKRIEVSELVFEKPTIRIVELRGGKLNVSTIGSKREGAVTKEKRPAGVHGSAQSQMNAVAGTPHSGGGAAALSSLYVRNLTVEDGVVTIEQQGVGQIADINAIDLHLKNFAADSPFTVTLAAAFFGREKNFDGTATIGPILKGGAMDVNSIPLSAIASVGPVSLAQFKKIPQLAAALPPKLLMPDPVTIALSADGTAASIRFTLSGDLSANRVTFGDTFNKAANVPLKFSVEGTREDKAIGIGEAKITLADLDLTAANVRIRGGKFDSHIETNNFALGPVAKLVPALAAYDLSGNATVTTGVEIANGNPSATGRISLSDAGAVLPGQNMPRLSGVGGKIELTGTTADIGPLTFNLGKTQVTLKAHAESFQPAILTYDLESPGQIHPADFIPSRPQSDVISDLTASGRLDIEKTGRVVAAAKVATPSGNLNGAPYKNLSFESTLQGDYARLTKFDIDAFSGNFTATGGTGLKPGSPFTASASFTNINVQQALESQNLKAAGTVQGTVGGTINLTGKTGTFDAMKPTFQGNGQLTLTNGKIIGINVGADALKKVHNLPLVGDLVPKSVIDRHPELFSNPDTDIQIASLNYVVAGPRITTHDLKVQTQDYSLFGDGWIDLDKNIAMAAQIVLERQFSGDLIAAKRNIQYLADRNGQIIVPLQLAGQLPKPAVVPDVAQLAQRASERAVENQGQKFLGKLLKKKGLGSIFGGGDNSAPENGSGSPPAGGSNPPANPLDQLKKLF